MFIGHKTEAGQLQALGDHLKGVSDLAAAYSQSFSAQAHARRVGLLHDAGKYSEAAQQRMADPERTPKVDHSTAGAKIAWEHCRDGAGALAVAGHHGGMPDLGGKLSSEGDGTLMGRLKKELSGRLDYSPFWQENHVDTANLLPGWLTSSAHPFAGQFYTRMLFSSLVDADFIDTERFMRGEKSRGRHDSMDVLLDRLRQYVQPWLEKPTGEINRRRCEILKSCMEAGQGPRGLYTLTVPTGGGKTVSSLAFALTHAVKHGMDRVIYVIPYTSIIEQNARVFKVILGEDNVIEHHCGVDWDVSDDMEAHGAMRQMLATENWDAPVIVTTAVQFFESLFSNKPSRCRKLHSIAGSVVIFDEAQMLPLSYLKPCVAAIAELLSHYRVTPVLCTATQPSLGRLFSGYDRNIAAREICGNVDELQAVFRRVHFMRKETMDCDALAQELAQREQVLCIVNTRKTAQQVFERLPEGDSFHLSTRMTADHRSQVLEGIRDRLRGGMACRVVSTSLIEAGVDVDFPEVWREMAGLDSILQAAGRCNREGRRPVSQSRVVIFALDQGVPRGMQPNAAAAEMAMEGTESMDDRETVRRYFEQLYWQRGEQTLDSKDMMKLCSTLNMKSIAERFHLIDSDTCTVYIPTDDNEADMQCLKTGRISRGLLRRLGRSAVNLPPWEWARLMESGVAERISESTAILTDPGAYDPFCGIKTEFLPGMGLWV